MGLRLNIGGAHPALKRGANHHCAYGAGDRLFAVSLLVVVCFAVPFSGCKGKEDGASAPAPKVIQVADMNLITVDPDDAAQIPHPHRRPDRIRNRVDRNRQRLSRHLPRDSRHLAGQWPRGGHQGPARRQREEGPTAAQSPKPGYYRRLRHLPQSRQRRAHGQYGVYARRRSSSITAPSPRPCLERPRIPRRTPRPT